MEAHKVLKWNDVVEWGAVLYNLWMDTVHTILEGRVEMNDRY